MRLNLSMPGCAAVTMLRMAGMVNGASASLVILGKRAGVSGVMVPNIARKLCTAGPRCWAMA